MCPCISRFWWRLFSAFVVDCDLINGKNLADIKLGVGTVNSFYYSLIKILTYYSMEQSPS
jgi:hypothetical protein